MASKSLLWDAYLAGFKRSAEGWNGEFPWYRGEEKRAEMKESLREGVDGFEDWYDGHVIEFTCKDCDKDVCRPRNDTIDIDGLTPVRCATCTLDRMAERRP